MSPWRLELLRLWRTRRALALAGVFLLLGVAMPILTTLLPKLVNGESGNGVTIIAPPAKPSDAIVGFAQNAAQLGTLVVVIVAAVSLALDARPALATFYRTRVRRPSMLILPRFAVVAAAAVIALVLGAVAAGVVTVDVLGPFPVATQVAGCALAALWVVFCVALTAAWAAVARSVLAAAGLSLGTLLALAFAGSIGAVGPWVPSRLAAAVVDLMPGRAGVPWRAALVSAVATVLLLVLAVRLVAGPQPSPQHRPGPSTGGSARTAASS
jgi:ABC-2 type transport system permease protein